MGSDGFRRKQTMEHTDEGSSGQGILKTTMMYPGYFLNHRQLMKVIKLFWFDDTAHQSESFQMRTRTKAHREDIHLG